MLAPAAKSEIAQLGYAIQDGESKGVDSGLLRAASAQLVRLCARKLLVGSSQEKNDADWALRILSRILGMSKEDMLALVEQPVEEQVWGSA